MVWYFIGVYILNRTLHGRLEMRNFSSWSRVEKIFHEWAWRENSYLRAAYGSPGGPNSDFVVIFHFSIFVFHFLIFTSPFAFSVEISVFIFYFSVSAFNVLIFTSPFCFSVEISVFIILLFHFCFLTFLFLPIYFVLLFSFCFGF